MSTIKILVILLQLVAAPIEVSEFYFVPEFIAVAKSKPIPKVSNDVDRDLQNAIILLKKGNVRRAKKYLRAIIEADSDHEVAKDLLKQIKTSAKKYFGKKHFKYRIKKGDSLSQISKKYLGDSLKFYALAKYNKIKNPGSLVVGKLIKIPGDPPGIDQISKPLHYQQASNKPTKTNFRPKKIRKKHNTDWIDGELAKAIGMLKQGRRTHAKSVISAVLKKEPGNKLAKKLLKQIIKPPYRYFGKSYFWYRVQKGQDFTKLARKFLNDSANFYALARYNDIIPNKLNKGAIVRIPGIMPQRDYNRIIKSISLLKRGRRTQAQKELKIVKWYYPKDKTVLSLLEQIDKKPVEYFGEKHFEYKVKPGETLSTLSEKFLNDPLKFYALARYNTITVPKRLRPGITIKIPGEHPDKKGSPGPEYELAKKYFGKKKFKDAYLLLEKLEVETKHRALQERENTLLVHCYTKQAGLLFADKDYKEAFKLMEKASNIEIKDETVKEEYAKINNLLFAERHFNEGIQQLDDKDRVAAYLSFQEALKFNPKHQAAEKQSEALKPRIIDNLYKKGIVAFRRQELDEAISAWDLVLSIEPEHDLAKRNMQRALDLKKKAEQFPEMTN